MKKLWSTVLLMSLLVTSIAGCSSARAITPDNHDMIITLERTPSLGNLLHYKLTVHGDGTLVFEDLTQIYRHEGEELPRGGGGTKLSQEKIQGLISEFEKIDYFSLDDRYVRQTITDVETVITSISINSKTKRVEHYRGDLSAPQELTQLEDNIDEIVNSAQWINSIGGQTTPSTNMEEFVITLERTACLGTCPVYSLVIKQDGAVIYEGQDFVRVKGYAETNIGRDKVSQLVSAFEAAGYFSLKNSYTERTVTDLPTVITSISVEGTTKTVEHYKGDKNAPEALTQLEDKIDEIVKSARWVN